MQAPNGATWPPGPRAEFLGLAFVNSDGTFTTTIYPSPTSPAGDAIACVTGVDHPDAGTYVLHVATRVPGMLPCAIVIQQGVQANALFKQSAQSAGPDPSVTISASNGGEGQAAGFVAAIFCGFFQAG